MIKFRHGKKIFSFPIPSIPDLGPTEQLIPMLPGPLPKKKVAGARS
jgi:hypothetical protein